MKKILKLLTMTLISVSFLFVTTCSKKGKWSMPPVVVATSAVQTKDFQETIFATGSLFSFEKVTVTPEIEGKVVKIHFQSGQIVKKDDLLIELDASDIQTQLKKATAQLTVSQSNYDRFYQLYLKKFYDAADLDQAKATVATNQAEVDHLTIQLQKTQIKAPFDGKIGLRQISLGEYLTPGKPIVDLQSLNPLYVEFSVPEVYLSKLQVENKIHLMSSAFPNQSYEGNIYAIDSMVDPHTRMLSIRAKIPNPEHQLIPGLSTEVTIEVNAPQPILLIPQTAVVYSSEGNFVYRLIEHKAIKTNVTLGEKLPNDQVIIKKGLTTNDVVILGGQVKLQDGANVITEKEAH